jgi:hypothetical protein
MPSRVRWLSSIALGGMLVLSACSSSPAASLAPGQTQQPGATQNNGNGNGNGNGNQGGTVNCGGIPTFNASPLVMPSIPGDSELQAKFPQTVAGQPITKPQTQNWAQYMCAYAPNDVQATAQRLAAIGIDLNALSTGTFHVMINDQEYTVNVIRIKGHNISDVLGPNSIAAFAAAWLGPNANVPTGLTSKSVGGKNVLVGKDTSGDSVYYYMNGDTAFNVNENDESVAAAVFSSLP